MNVLMSYERLKHVHISLRIQWVITARSRTHFTINKSVWKVIIKNIESQYKCTQKKEEKKGLIALT